jgi:hypothetical protein
MLGASQPAQAKPWLDRRLLAAIPFLPVVTILAGTAVPMPRSPGAEQQGSVPSGRRRLRRPHAESAVNTVASP